MRFGLQQQHQASGALCSVSQSRRSGFKPLTRRGCCEGLLSTRLRRIHADILSAARRRTVVTYGQLMKRHRLSRGRKLSQTIGEIDRAECEKGGPGFAAIIVRKDTGFPGGGYFCDDELPPALQRPRSRASDPRLSSAEIRFLRRQQRSIWDYYGS
jgi:hypothetical protein